MPLRNILSSIGDSEEYKDIISLQIDSPELESMRALADTADYQGIFDLCVELSERGIYDIRLILYSLYSDYQKNGLIYLDENLEDLTNILSRYWELIGPEDRRNKYAKNSLAWLLKQILIDLQTLQLEQSERWSELLDSTSREHIERVIDLAEGLKIHLNARLDDAAAQSFIHLKELMDWLSEFKGLLPMPAHQEAEGDDSVDSVSNIEAPIDAHRLAPLISPQISSGSVHLQLLNQKLALFQEVLSQGDIVKAAVIAMDVNHQLESFDPKKYFPELFSDYFSNMVNHGDEINEIIEMSGSPKWQALVNLYEVDLDKFKDISV